MVRLTEEMIAARTRINDCTQVKKLNCWGAELDDISIIRKMKNVQILSLSVNNITSLADFQNCEELEDLFIRKNNIKDLNSVCFLRNLPKLRNLWLSENPCAEEEGYRLAVIRALPNLERLDDKAITPEELQTALVTGKVLVHPMANIIQAQENTAALSQANSQSESDSSKNVDNLNNCIPLEEEKHNKNFNEQEKVFQNCNDFVKNSCCSNINISNSSNDTQKIESCNQIKNGQNDDQNCNNQCFIDTRCPQLTCNRGIYSSNPLVLSAVLCLINLIKELDYQSLEVVEMVVKSSME